MGSWVSKLLHGISKAQRQERIQKKHFNPSQVNTAPVDPQGIYYINMVWGTGATTHHYGIRRVGDSRRALFLFWSKLNEISRGNQGHLMLLLLLLLLAM
jgi:hypothetical protein